jgi:hypothetical protein
MQIIPTILEKILRIQQNNGNMGLYGIYLDLYLTRNLFYISWCGLIILFYFQLTLFGLFLFISFLIFFLYKINKWLLFI